MNKGKLVQVIGPVIDVRFENELPDIYNALEVQTKSGKLVAEVHSHNGNNVVRAVAMSGTDGLRRGLEVIVFFFCELVEIFLQYNSSQFGARSTVFSTYLYQ